MYRGPIGTHQRSFGRYHPRPPTPIPLHRLEVCNPHTKLQSPIMSGTGKATDFKYSQGQSEQKPMKNLAENSRGRNQDVLKFSGHPYMGHIVWSSLRQHSFLVIELLSIVTLCYFVAFHSRHSCCAFQEYLRHLLLAKKNKSPVLVVVLMRHQKSIE